jgi:Protein of unknown function (DUF3182)
MNRTRGVVVTYSSQTASPLRAHQRALLAVEAKAIATLKGYEFGGQYNEGREYGRHVFFVPDDALLLEEARSRGIRTPDDLYGGVVPYPFSKTKSITHPLVDDRAERPDGWSNEFCERVRGVVLAGYTAFNARDARKAAGQMLQSGSVRVKEPLHAGGKGQTMIENEMEIDPLLERLPQDDIGRYGLVLEENLNQVTTLSIGQVMLGDQAITYYGSQRLTTDNCGQRAYGGSDLVCVRGGWDAVCPYPMSPRLREALAQARLYDDAMKEYPGFMASRQNYDIGQGLDEKGRNRSAVFESSWRAGGASPAELAAFAEFVRDPSAQLVEASHIEQFGKDIEPPPGAIVHFQADDPLAGPMIRYTIIKRVSHSPEAW